MKIVPRSCIVLKHNSDFIMRAMACEITSLTIVYSTVFQAQIQENIKAPRHSPLKGPVTRKMFPFDDVIIESDSSQQRHRCR